MQLLTPKRRSTRTPQTDSLSTGRAMAATGFAYAPNEALQARMAHMAAEGKLVLGDAQDLHVLASMHKAGIVCTGGGLPHCTDAAGQKVSCNLTCHRLMLINLPLRARTEAACLHRCPVKLCLMSALSQPKRIVRPA